MASMVGTTSVTAALALSAAFLAVSASACDQGTAMVEPGESAQTSAQPATSSPPATTTAPAQTSTKVSDPAQVQDELLSRWNAAAAARDLDPLFHWSSFNQFPHPTFKGGSYAAYRDFAAVLLTFFQEGDTFDFLARNDLFELRLVYIFPSGASGFDTSFRELATTFTRDDGCFGDIASDVRQGLRKIAERIPTT